MRRGAISSDDGFTFVEVLIATVILAGAFVALTSVFPIAALAHRGALEKEIAASLAQHEIEHLLTNPGPFPGTTGVTADFVNAAEFPPGYTGTFAASDYLAGPGLTQIVVRVTPPHGPVVQLTAIDTTFQNLVP